jgi:hypothetical protein
MFRTAELNHNLKTAMFEKVLEYLWQISIALKKC